MAARGKAEAKKPKQVPGIVFDDEGGERVARIAGTGLEVFEVIQVYHACHKDMERLHRAFPWLTTDQLSTAVAYYEAYPAAVEAAIADNLACMPES